MSGDARPTGRPTDRVVEVSGSHLDRATPVANNGRDSSASQRQISRRLGSRGLERLKESLSNRDRAIIDSVGALRLLSARQIERLHFHASALDGSPLTRARSCRRVLERLVRNQLLYRLDRRVGGIRAGSVSFIYSLGPIGQRIIASDGARRRPHEPSLAFAGHTLDISETVVALREAARDDTFEVLELVAEPGCWRSFQDLSGAHQLLKPDLFASLGVQELEHRWFIEVDRSTEHAGAIRRKAQVYLGYLRSGREQALHSVFPKVLWIADTPKRADQLANWLNDIPAPEARQLFGVTTREDALTVLGGRP